MPSRDRVCGMLDVRYRESPEQLQLARALREADQHQCVYGVYTYRNSYRRAPLTEIVRQQRLERVVTWVYPKAYGKEIEMAMKLKAQVGGTPGSFKWRLLCVAPDGHSVTVLAESAQQAASAEESAAQLREIVSSIDAMGGSAFSIPTETVDGELPDLNAQAGQT